MKKLITLATAACLLPGIASAQSEYIQRAMEKKFGAAGMSKLNDWVDNHLTNVKMEESYVFPYDMNMHITTYKNGNKKDEADMRYFFNPDKQYFASETVDRKKKQDMLIIYDYKENAMLMLKPKEKTGIAFNINAFMSGEAIANREQNAKKSTESASVSCKKSGRTKDIQNYSCSEYVCTDEENNTRTEVWITDRIAVNIAATKGPGSIAHLFGSAGELNGLMMAGDFYKNDQLESRIEITSINEKANLSIQTAEYTFSNGQ